MLLSLKVEEGLAVFVLLGALVVDALTALDDEQTYDSNYPSSLRGTALICVLAAASPSLSLSPRTPFEAPQHHRYVGIVALLLSALAGTRVASRELRLLDALYSSAGVVLAAIALGIIRTLNFDALAGAPGLQSHAESLKASNTKRVPSEVSVSASDDALRALSEALLCYLGGRQLRAAFDASKFSGFGQVWHVLAGSSTILAGVGGGSTLGISLFGLLVAAFAGTLALSEPLQMLPEFACENETETMADSERRRRMLGLTPAASWMLAVAVALLLSSRLRYRRHVAWLVGLEANVFGVLLAACYAVALAGNHVPLWEANASSESQVAVAGVVTYTLVISSALCVAARRVWQARLSALIFVSAVVADEVALIASDGTLLVYANPTHSFLWVISLSMLLHVLSSWAGFERARRGAAAAGVSASLLLFLCSCAVLSTASGERLGVDMLRTGGECATRVARSVAVNAANHFLPLFVWAGLLVHDVCAILPSGAEAGGLSEPVATVLWLGAGTLPWLGWVLAVSLGADAGKDTALSTVDDLAVAIAAVLVVAPAWFSLGAACCFVSLVPQTDDEKPRVAQFYRGPGPPLPLLALPQCPCERTTFLKHHTRVCQQSLVRL